MRIPRKGREAVEQDRANDHRSALLTTDEARQGVTGQYVRYVLAAGCALVVALFIVVYIFAGS
jgi:hypothetical protein